MDAPNFKQENRLLYDEMFAIKYASEYTYLLEKALEEQEHNFENDDK